MEQLLKRFLIAIKGGDYFSLPVEIAREEMVFLLENAISAFPYPKQNLLEFDREQGWTFPLTLLEERILVGLMVTEWLTTNINSMDLATVDMTTAEIRTFSKTNQVKALLDWRNGIYDETHNLIALYHKTGDNNQPALQSWGGDGSGN